MGYSNYDNGDHSKNTSPWGFIMLGELFQNNHHFKKLDPNFAKKWFEFDGTFFIMRILNRLKIISFTPLVLEPVTVMNASMAKDNKR
jgi:Fatty-acid desaturase